MIFPGDIQVAVRMWSIGPVVVIRMTPVKGSVTYDLCWVGWRGGRVIRRSQQEDRHET